MTFSEVDVVSKLIPDVLGISLKEAIDTEPRLQELMENDPKINTLMGAGAKLKVLFGMRESMCGRCDHSGWKNLNHAPLYRGADGENVVQYDMKHAEKLD